MIYVPDTQQPFNGDFTDSDGNIRNLMALGDAPSNSPKHSMMPFNGTFYASDGSVHNIDELMGGQNADLSARIDEIEAIAKGATKAKAFDTIATLDAWIAVSANKAALQVGDVFLIRAKDVPDYWWDGTAKQELETLKFVLELATAANDGLMSKGDFAKLAGIATGATKVMTPSDIGAAASTHSHAAEQVVTDAAKRFTSDAEMKAVTVYDVIIRTQADFVALYSSVDWLGAKSVAFIGDGGTLKFTRATTGLKIPPTVKRIDGFNSAIIEITGYSGILNEGVLWYETLPMTDDYSINNISALCSMSASSVGCGFSNCTQLTNCTGTSTGKGFGHGFYNCTQLTNCTGTTTTSSWGFAFRDCTQLTNCTGTHIATGYGCGFYYCTQLTNCTGNGTGSYSTSFDSLSGWGFGNCTQLTNCTGTGTSTSSNKGWGFDRCTQLTNCTGTGTGGSYSRGFSNCTQLTNCTGTGTGGSGAGSNSFSFYDCSFLNGCKEGTTLSTTGIWGGTWLFRDDDSCQLTR